MANCNKVVIDGVTKIDLTGDSVTAADVAEGKTFHDASGTQKTGTKAEPKLQSKSVTITSNGTINIKSDSGYDGLNEAIVTVNVSASTAAEKCTIVLTHSGIYSTPITYAYQCVMWNGSVSIKVGTLAKGSSVTLSDVACGSMFSAVGRYDEYFDVSSNITETGGEWYDDNQAGLICAITPKKAGETGTITVLSE